MARGARAAARASPPGERRHKTWAGLSSSWTWSQPFLFSVVASSTSLAPIIDRSGSAPTERAACKRHSSTGARAGCSRENGGALHGRNRRADRGWVFAGCKELAFLKDTSKRRRDRCRGQSSSSGKSF